MLKQETLDYIIEKMRGDSLTPLGLGNGRDVSSHPEYIELLLDLGSRLYSSLLRMKYIMEDESYVVNYGKWELVVNSSKFYKSGFYYRSILSSKGFEDMGADDIPIYLFFTSDISTRFIFHWGVRITSSLEVIDDTSPIISDMYSRLSIEAGDLLLKKYFGIKTFLRDFSKYGIIGK